MPKLRKPRALRPGSAVALAAPAFAADAERIARGTERLGAAGFRVRQREDLEARQGYLAGSDERRAAELAEWVADDDVGAILCVRGGYGCQRMLDRLDARAFRSAARPLVGYSDVTTLLLWQLRCAGLAGIHGPMLDMQDGLDDAELTALRRALEGDDAGARLRGEGRVGGRAEGVLIGGSLTLLAASLGTPWELDTRGALLLFEDIGEKPYAIDRLLVQLRAAGKLDGVAGVGVGHLVGCVDPKRAEPSAEQVIEEILAPLGVPLVFGLPFGHAHPNLPWPVGVRGALDGGRGELEILESGVTRE